MTSQPSAFTRVDVECYAGYRGEETPRRFRVGQAQIEISEIVERWVTPDYRYFKVQDARGERYLLRNNVADDRWEARPTDLRFP